MKVDVAQLGPAERRLEVHQDTDAALRGTGDVELASADHGHVAQADGARRSGREQRVHVVGSREHDTHQVVVVDPVAGEHLPQQLHDAVLNLLGGVVVDRGGTTQGSQHRCGC